VARYFQDGLRNEPERERLSIQLFDMADRLYYSEFANILMFVIYLTRNTELIEHIVANADEVYGKLEACDLEKHVEFINRLYKEAPRLVLPPTDVEENREQRRRELDEAEAETGDFLSVTDSEKLKYNDALKDVVKINIALKSIELMGQVLRNFPGSLRKDLKTRITLCSYLLGLRTMRAIFKIAEENLEDVRTYIAGLLKEHKAFDTDGELARTTDEALIGLTRACAFAIVKRVSYAVGLQILQETYKAALERGKRQTALRVIDLSVKLDHFTGFPELEVEGLWEDQRKNLFSSTVVRDLVANHLYLFPVKLKTKQKIGQLLKIEINAPKIRGTWGKKLKE
jgi:hypothetical protein